MSAKHPQESSLGADQLARFRRDGFVVVRQLFAPREIAEIRETFMDGEGSSFAQERIG